MNLDVEVEVARREHARRIDVRISIPFEQYAQSLYPNETLREAVFAAFDKFLEEQPRR